MMKTFTFLFFVLAFLVVLLQHENDCTLFFLQKSEKTPLNSDSFHVINCVFDETVPFLCTELPPYITMIDSNVWKPNWKKGENVLYYIERDSGNVISLDIVSEKKSNLTASFGHTPFAYCLSLVNGDLLLCGNTSDPTGDAAVDDHRQEMWILNEKTARLQSLNEYCDRSPAVSSISSDIAWTLPGQVEVCSGRIVYHNGIPSIEKRRKILSFKDSTSIRKVETQDFLPPYNSELLITGFSGSQTEPFNYADVFGYNLKTGSLVNYSKSPRSFNESRGVAPDGKNIYIESDRHFDCREWKTDIYRITLDGSGATERLTSFSSDFPGCVVENPVVSHDGKFLAFQVKYNAQFYIFILDIELYHNYKPKKNEPA